MIYEISDEDLDSFETWLEVYLFHNEIGGSAFHKVEIVNTLKNTYMTKRF